jgi:peptidoglycan/LPS O-acetylase OafA/YrhL
MAVTTDPVKTWETKSSTGKHFEVLDGIRGVAILMVVFYHAMYVNPDSGPIAQAVFKLFQTGRVGVPVFFVLSGFLISFPFFRQREANSRSWWVKHYARRRIGKIIPPFYLSIILFGLYYYLRFSNPAYIVAGLGWALGVSNFFPQHILFNSSYWSLLVEGQFYILLPILFLVTRGLKVRSTTVCLFLILFVIPLLFRQFTWPKHAVDKDPIIFAVTRFPGALDFFAWGVLFAGSFVPLFQTGQDFRAFSVFGYAGIVLLAATLPGSGRLT